MLTKILKWPKFGRMGKTKAKATTKAKTKSAPAKAGKAPKKSAKPASVKTSKVAKPQKKTTLPVKPAAKKPAKAKAAAKANEKNHEKGHEKGKKVLKSEPQVKGGKAAAVAKAKVAPVKGRGKIEKPVVTIEIEEEILLEEPAPPEPLEEVVLTDAEGRRYCRVKDCDQLATVEAFCRYHYLLYWKKIQIRKKILTEGKLERYIEDLTARYPDKFLDMLRKDLKSEKEFLAAIQELEIDESQVENEFEDEQENFIEEVRGMSEPSSASRDDEDF